MTGLVRNDLSLYDRHGDAWWDTDRRQFRSLRAVKEFHLGLIDEHVGPLDAATRVADLGCGGGLLSIAVAERGARVYGVDLSAPSLRTARAEARARGCPARFVRADLRRTPLEGGSFDLVLLSDVLEHVSQPERAIAEASRLLRCGGRLFVNTFDRTLLADLLVVRLAEGLGFVPRGTHDSRMFVKPSELDSMAARSGLARRVLQRERPLLWRTALTGTIRLTRARTGFGYAAVYGKVAA